MTNFNYHFHGLTKDTENSIIMLKINSMKMDSTKIELEREGDYVHRKRKRIRNNERCA